MSRRAVMAERWARSLIRLVSRARSGRKGGADALLGTVFVCDGKTLPRDDETNAVAEVRRSSALARGRS